MSVPASVAVFGATGLTGSHILSTLLAADSQWKPVTTIARRTPKDTSSNLNAIVESDTSKWAPALAQLSPPPSVVVSSLGTTRAAAGGLQEQWKIDHDLNIELAKAAKEAGAKTFVFVSAAGVRGALAARSPYCQMKIGVEDAVKDLAFDQSIIMAPGTILGERDHYRTIESWWKKVVYGLGKIQTSWQDKLGQDADTIGRATVKALELAAEGKAPSKHWVVDSAEILRLGKQEGEAAKPQEATSS